MCVCASAIVRRNEYGFCNSLGTPSGLAHLNAKRKEGNKKRERETKSKRCATERESRTADEERAGGESFKLKENMWRASCGGPRCGTDSRVVCL